VSKFFPMEDGYAPGDAAQPVRQAAPSLYNSNVPSALGNGQSMNARGLLIGAAVLGVLIYLAEHHRINRKR
jgi:hypothetical protein